MAANTRTWHITELQSAGAERHAVVPRFIAGVPLLGIGLAHVFDPSAPMRPLVEAAGLPVPALLSPVAVAVEILAGALLLLGLYARLGAALAVPAMVVALYAHAAIDVWPNSAGEPPIALPVVVLAASAYVLWRGAGRWSLDHRFRAPARRKE